MIRRSYSICVLFLFLSTLAFAQDEELRTVVDYKVDKMKTELNLTDSQADAIRPIIKDYFIKRQAVLDETTGEGIVDHVAVKETLKGLRDNEHQKLSKILSEDQMNKLVNKENLMATLNPDSPDSSVDSDTTLTAAGANFKF